MALAPRRWAGVDSLSDFARLPSVVPLRSWLLACKALRRSTDRWDRLAEQHTTGHNALRIGKRSTPAKFACWNRLATTEIAVSRQRRSAVCATAAPPPRPQLRPYLVDHVAAGGISGALGRTDLSLAVGAAVHESLGAQHQPFLPGCSSALESIERGSSDGLSLCLTEVNAARNPRGVSFALMSGGSPSRM
jgi:hypothetical protein